MVPSQKTKSFNTSEWKNIFKGDWISILNFPLIILVYYLFYNAEKVTDDFENFAYVAIILSAALGLFCVFKYSKEYKFSKLGPSFWIILFGFIWWTYFGSNYNYALERGGADQTLFGETILHDVIFWGSLLLSFIINLSKIKNFFGAISYTFGQIPFIFIFLFFVKGATNAMKRK